MLQYAGDSILAVFGAKDAREDDPERAVGCGLAIVREAERIGAEVRATSDGDFNVRVGIHTGSVLLGGGVDDVSTIRGIAVNIAARMEQTAPVGGVRISHETQRHVRGKFYLSDEAPIAVKGFTEPMRSHLVLGVTPNGFGTVGRGIEGVAVPMVGRDSELAKLIEAYETVRDERTLMLVTVSGDAGLGKTRLMVELEHWLERNHPGAACLRGRAQPYSNSVPYGLLRDMLARHFQILDSDSQAMAQSKLGQGLQGRLSERSAEDVFSVGRLIGLDYSMNTSIAGLEGEGRQIRDGAFRVIAHYLRALVGDSGTAPVLLLDDLHWADDGSLDFVNHIAACCPEMPIFVLCLTRPALFERRPLWCSGRDNQQRIDLLPLSKRNSRNLTEALLARLNGAPVALRDLVTSSAEGNPYFIEELIGMLIDDGAIVADGERWKVDADRLVQVRVPSTLAGVLQARLAALPPQELATLQHASVIGHVFWDEALQQMAPVASEVIEGLMRRDLARGRDPSSFEGTREYVFKHHLLHKVTYDSVLKRDKREQHRLTAEWLVARSGERASEYHGVIADHFEKAGDTANAILYLRKAAGDAAMTYAMEVAFGYFDRALALMPESPDKFDLLIKRTNAAFQRRGAVQERDLIELEQLAEALNDDSRRALAASFRTSYLADFGDLARTSAAAVKAIAYGKASGNAAATMRAHNQWGRALWASGEVSAAKEQLELGLALGRSAGNWMGEASALEQLGRMANRLGRHGEARGYLEAARNVAQRENDHRWVDWFRWTLAEIELSIGHHGLANDQLLAVLKGYRMLRWPEGEAEVAVRLARSAYARAEYPEALAWLDQALEADPGNEGLEFQVVYHFCRADVHAALGQVGKATIHYERSASACRDLHRPLAALEMQAALARLSLSHGEPLHAKTLISPVVAQLDTGWRLEEFVMDDLRVLLTCYEVLAALGDKRAREFCSTANEKMLARANLLQPRDRDAYLSNVCTNRRIREEWQSIQ